MRHITLLTLLLLVLVPATLKAQEDSITSGDVPRYQSAACPVAVPSEFASRVRCGVLTVPESRDEGSDPTKTIRLPVAVIASTSATPSPDPLVVPTAGGPGLSSLERLDEWLYYGGWALGERDVILMEQRGTRYADPRLDCPEVEAQTLAALETADSPADEQAREVESARACHDRLVAQGIDLSAYTSAASAADAADLRAALGFDQWNLFGISYGGRLALAILRDHPEGLRSVILDSPDAITINRYEAVPPSFAAALDRLFAGCAADADCHARYPDLQAEFYEIVRRSNDAPLAVSVKNAAGAPVTLHLTGDDLTAGIFNALYDAQVIRVLPFLIDQIDQGNLSVVEPLAQQTLDRSGADAGMMYSVECREELPFNDRMAVTAAYAAHPALAAFDVNRNLPAICDLWDVPPPPPAWNEPVVSAVPTLLLAGEYDPIHPAFWSEAAAATLSHHVLYVFPGLGHAQVYSHDCPRTIAASFLHDPAAEPDAGCIASMRAPDFLTAADIYTTPAIYRLNADVIEAGDPLQIAGLAVTLMVLLVALVYGIAALLLRRRRVPPLAILLMVVAALADLAFVVGLVLVLFNTDFLVLGFGLPTSARPLLILPFVALAAAILLAVLMLRAWLRRAGRRADRIILSLAAVAMLVFAVWLRSRGLLTL